MFIESCILLLYVCKVAFESLSLRVIIHIKNTGSVWFVRKMVYLGPVIVRFECRFSVVAVVKSRQISVGAFQVSVCFLCLSLCVSLAGRSKYR